MGAHEDDLSQKWARCKLDASMKSVGGGLLGGLGSLTLAGRAPWPMVLGAGLGLGLAYTNCEQHMNEALQKKDGKEGLRKKCP